MVIGDLERILSAARHFISAWALPQLVRVALGRVHEEEGEEGQEQGDAPTFKPLFAQLSSP